MEGARGDALFLWPVRVYYEDTDAGGVVYYANYLKFFERCRTEWLRALQVDQAKMAGQDGLQFVVSQVQCRYLRPARLDDELSIEARVADLARCSLTFDQRALRGDELLAQAQVRIACVDVRSGRPGRLPADLMRRLADLKASAERPI
jgi:tol-pal system-associated acyl-CoA thioesterase